MSLNEYTMSEPTSGEDDWRSGGRCVDVLSRPAGKVQEHDRFRLAGGCGRPMWKPSILRQASLQVSPDMARQEFNSIRIEGCLLAPEDTGVNRGVLPRYAWREVSKTNSFKILHPATGNLRKHSLDWHPSVGSFKREEWSEYLRY